MECPRCKSERIQRDYDDAVFFIRMFGLHKLLCNNCGLVFKGFDPLRTHQREPSEKKAEPAAAPEPPVPTVRKKEPAATKRDRSRVGVDSDATMPPSDD